MLACFKCVNELLQVLAVNQQRLEDLSSLRPYAARPILQDVLGKADRMRRWIGHGPLFRQDPVLRGMVLLIGLAGLGFHLLAGHTAQQVQIFWLLQVPLDGLLAYCSWRVYGLTTGALRRFWRVLAVVGVMFMCGDSFQTVLTFVQPGQWSTNGGPVQTSCFALGLGAIVVAMLVHPHPGRTGRERLAFWLDSATVLVGGAVVAWCFAVKPGQTTEADVLSVLASSGVALTSAFAAVKMILSGNAPMHRTAAIAMIAAAVVTSLGFFLAPPTDDRLPAWIYLIRFLPSMLIATGPRMQEVIARFDSEEPFGERRRKPYSLLPYGSIVIAFGALVVVMPSGVNIRLWGVVAGLGLICAMVALRQLAAFHDNTSLIKQLDTTLAELREHETRLRHQALFDGLTGLANRTHFHEEVGAALTGPGTVSLLLIDLDGFKAVNDTLGHAAGDALLVAVAERLRSSVRAGDLAARLGGDEFAVLLRGCAGSDAENTADRIFQAFTVPADISGMAICANASIGVADAEDGDDVESLLRRADLAMYAAKSHGKGNWKRYGAGMETAGHR
jgi:diguanylate cyclase (GGDEF)-like protein